MSMSYEKFIIDEQIIAMVKRLIRPVTITDATIDLETIKEVGVGGEFLSHPTTFERFREEHFDTTLFNRLGYNEWIQKGGKDILARAGEVVRYRLESYQKPDIDREIEDRIDKYIQAKIRE